MEEEEVDQYDEFGNYIGPIEETGEFGNDLGRRNFDNEIDVHVDTEQHLNDNNFYNNDGYINNYNQMMVTSDSSAALVVLNEDKKYFPSAMEIYGESVQVMVEDEDAQALTEPIIAPIKEILVDSVVGEKSVPIFKYSLE